MTKNRLKTLAILNYIADGYDLKTIAHIFGLNKKEDKTIEKKSK